MTLGLRGDAGSSLAARFATLLPSKSSPFVTQSQLTDLMKADRSDIERQVRQAEWLMRHPQRGMSAAPYQLTDDWRKFLSWIDGAIRHLKQPKPVPELEHLIRTWQYHRANIAAPNLRWRRRADVIAVLRNSQSHTTRLGPIPEGYAPDICHAAGATLLQCRPRSTPGL